MAMHLCRAFSTFYLHGYRKADAGRKRSSSCKAHTALQDLTIDGSIAAGPLAAATEAAGRQPETTTAFSSVYSEASDDTTYSESDDAAILAHKQRLPTSQHLARSAFEFVVSSLRLPESGFFAWMASRNGSSILQANTVLYGQWFVLYGFSQYYTAFGDVRAKQYALDCFRAVDAAWHNSSTGGYNE
jgi:hypothetical protein